MENALPLINGHIHTPYSFSSFAGMDQPFEMAREEGEAQEEPEQVGEQDPFVAQVLRQAWQARAGGEAGNGQFIQGNEAQATEGDQQGVAMEDGHPQQGQGKEDEFHRAAEGHEASRDTTTGECGPEGSGYLIAARRTPKGEVVNAPDGIDAGGVAGPARGVHQKDTSSAGRRGLTPPPSLAGTAG